MLVEDMNGPFSNSFAHEIIKSMDDGSLFNFDTGIECNFDNLDQLDESHNPNHAHNHSSSKTGDELELEYLKMSNKAINSANPHHHHQQQHNFNQPDAELIELFEYTSQFSMDDTINSNPNLLAEHSSNQIQQNQAHLSSCGISEGNVLMMDSGSSASTSPLDQTTQNKLDLTIQGHTINKPKWWSDNLIEPSLISNPAPSSTSSNINSLLLSSSSNRYTGNNQEQDDECDSSGLFTNNNNGGSHIMQPLSNIIELKDFLFNNIDSINVQTINSISDDAPSPPLSNASSSSLTLTASSFSADNFIAYPNLISNLDENSENNNSANANSSEQVVVLEPEVQPQQSQIQNTDDSSSCSSSSSNLPAAQANYKAYVALPPLNENKPARKRIYTHNKVNSLLHSNLTIIKAKTLTANPANESVAGGGKVSKGAGKKAAKSSSSSLVVDKLNLSSPMKINLLTVVSGISNSKNFLKNCNLDDKTVIIDTTASNNNSSSSNSI